MLIVNSNSNNTYTNTTVTE